MNARFPNTVAAPLMLMDPDAKQRELTELLRISLTYGFANLDTLTEGMLIPLHYADTELFTNLETVELMDGLLVAGNVAAEVIVEHVLP